MTRGTIVYVELESDVFDIGIGPGFYKVHSVDDDAYEPVNLIDIENPDDYHHENSWDYCCSEKQVKFEVDITLPLIKLIMP